MSAQNGASPGGVHLPLLEDLPPPPLIELKCKGGVLAYLINGRYLRYRCHERTCRRSDDPLGKRCKVFHIKDLMLGGLTVWHEYEDRITGEVIREEANCHGIRGDTSRTR